MGGVLPMKAYLITTGIVFTIIVGAHIFEVIDRGRLFASDIMILVVAAGFSVWAWLLVGKAPRRTPPPL